MEQIVAQTQAELEQEGWIFDVTEKPDIPAKNVYRFVVDTDSITIAETDEQMPPLFEYLENLIKYGTTWVLNRYGALYPVEGYLRYSERLHKVVSFDLVEDGEGERLAMSTATYVEHLYRNGIWTNQIKWFGIEWDSQGAIRFFSRREPFDIPTLIVYDTDDYIGNVEEVIDAMDTNRPYAVKVENAAHTVTYTCTHVYKASPTRISFYSHYDKGGEARAIEVRINPETDYVEVRR